MNDCRVIKEALPLVYSATSALTIVYLSRRPIHLNQYSPLNDHSEDEDTESDLQHDRSNTGLHGSETTTIDRVQAQYQAQRSSGVGINLARLGLTALQLGLALLAIILFKDNQEHHNDSESTLWGDIVQGLAWSYALILSFIHVLRPQIADQFWIRPQLDLFYVLETILLSIQLYGAGVLYLPIADWPLWIKLHVVAWSSLLLLLWASLMTQPYQPITSVKKPKEGEKVRLPSLEYGSSWYSQLAFTWVNPLVYLGYKRPLLDIDLPDIEPLDRSAYSIKLYELVK